MIILKNKLITLKGIYDKMNELDIKLLDEDELIEYALENSDMYWEIITIITESEANEEIDKFVVTTVPPKYMNMEYVEVVDEMSEKAFREVMIKNAGQEDETD